jgi:cytidylate kinase
VPQIAETIMRLVKTGHVILVGRGSVAIAADLPGVFHVRLVASLPKRIDRVKSVFKLNAEDAVKHIRREDRGSRRYIQSNFHTSIDNDLLYHLVINTDRIPYGEAALLIAAEARKAFERDRDNNDKFGD